MLHHQTDPLNVAHAILASRAAYHPVT